MALRIIADREEEIDAFIPEEYWTLDATIHVEGEKKPLVASFYGKDKKKMTIHSKEEMDQYCPIEIESLEKFFVR